MTSTETITEPTTEPAAGEPGGSPGFPASQPTGLAGILGSGDHKVIGRLFIGFSLLWGVASALAFALGLLGNLSGGGLLNGDVNLRVFTIGQFGLVFGFALPLFVGLGMLIVPLQVGAASLAFPRAAAASLWAWLAGVVLLVVSYAINGGIAGGASAAVDLTFMALVIVVAALLLGAVCIATTAVALRAPGMTLDRVPMFTWSMLAATGVWLLTWPVLVANVILVRVDLDHAGLLFGTPTSQWDAVSWAFTQPQIFVVAIAVLGVVGDVIPTMAGRRQVSRNVMLGAVGAFAALSIGSWAQLVAIGDVRTEPLFVIVSFAIVLPVLAAAGGWGSMLAAGRPTMGPALISSLAAVVLLLVGVVVAALYAIGPLDLQVRLAGDTGIPLAAVGQAGFVLGAVAAGFVAAGAYWSSKISGGTMPSALGVLGSAAAFVGGLLWGVGLLLAGLSGRFTALDGAVDAFVVIGVLGVVVVAASLVLVGLGLVGSTGSSDNDPWGTGQTLEWATASPPAAGNLDEVPEITSPEPLVDARGGDAGGTDAKEAD